jgi:hypothetical protein
VRFAVQVVICPEVGRLIERPQCGEVTSLFTKDKVTFSDGEEPVIFANYCK